MANQQPTDRAPSATGAAGSANGAAADPTSPTLPRTAGRARAPRAATKTSPSEAPGDVQPRRADRRPEMIRQRREQRRQEYEKKQRQWFWTRLGLIGFLIVAVAGVGWLGYNLVRDRQLNQIPEGTNTGFNYVGAQHVADGTVVQYAESPPVGGEHYNAWQNCGYYSQPIRNENAVHSLEHGAVWIAYRPDLPQDQIDQLRQLAEQDYILVSPYPELQSPVVATAWNNQLALDSAGDPRLQQFIRYFKEGPQTPEPGARCTGGVGQPEAV